MKLGPLIKLLVASCLVISAQNSYATQESNSEVKDQASRPNIILVMTDDQGYGEVVIFNLHAYADYSGLTCSVYKFTLYG